MFYVFRQNNSYGSFQGPAKYVYVEADNPDEANERAEEVAGLYFDGCEDGMDCPCCGDRWYRQWDCDKGSEAPELMVSRMGLEFCISDKVPVAAVYPKAEEPQTLSVEDCLKLLGVSGVDEAPNLYQNSQLILIENKSDSSN